MGEEKREVVNRSLDEWRAIVSRFEHSGQGCPEICMAEDLAPSTFWWRRNLGRTGSVGATVDAAYSWSWRTIDRRRVVAWRMLNDRLIVGATMWMPGKAIRWGWRKRCRRSGRSTFMRSASARRSSAVRRSWPTGENTARRRWMPSSPGVRNSVGGWTCRRPTRSPRFWCTPVNGKRDCGYSSTIRTCRWTRTISTGRSGRYQPGGATGCLRGPSRGVVEWA